MKYVTPEDINNALDYHPATPATVEKHERVRELFKQISHELNDILPEGPTKTHLLRIKIPEAMRAANASVACDTKGELG